MQLLLFSFLATLLVQQGLSKAVVQKGEKGWEEFFRDQTETNPIDDNFDLSTLVYSCEKIKPYRASCSTGFPSQFVLRWYWNEDIGACAPYGWGYCRGEDAVRSHPSIRSLQACVEICGRER